MLRGISIMRRLISSLVIATFCLTGSAAFAQFGAVKEGAKKAGSATKEAGKATVDTTKDVAKATEKGTKKVAGKPRTRFKQTTSVLTAQPTRRRSRRTPAGITAA